MYGTRQQSGITPTKPLRYLEGQNDSPSPLKKQVVAKTPLSENTEILNGIVASSLTVENYDFSEVLLSFEVEGLIEDIEEGEAAERTPTDTSEIDILAGLYSEDGNSSEEVGVEEDEFDEDQIANDFLGGTVPEANVIDPYPLRAPISFNFLNDSFASLDLQSEEEAVAAEAHAGIAPCAPEAPIAFNFLNDSFASLDLQSEEEAVAAEAHAGIAPCAPEAPIAFNFLNDSFASLDLQSEKGIVDINLSGAFADLDIQ